MRFRLLMLSVVVAIAAYSVYWFVLSGEVRDQVEDWVAVHKAEGYQVSYGSFSVSGYPYRLEIEIVKPDIRTPDNAFQLHFQSPRVVMETLPWKPTHILILAETATLDMKGLKVGPVTASVHGVKTSVVTDTKGAPQRISALTPSVKWHVAAQPDQVSTAGYTEAHFRTRHGKGKSLAMEVGGRNNDSNPSEPPLADFALKATDIRLTGLPRNPYGDHIGLVQILIELRGMSVPGQNIARMSAWRDKGGTVDVPQLLVKWGDFDARASGTVTLDQAFRPMGAFVVRARGYEPMIDFLQAAGDIDHEMAANAKATLGMIASTGTDEDQGRINVPVSMQNGRLFVGPLPVAKVQSLEPFLIPAETPPTGKKPVKKPAGTP